MIRYRVLSIKSFSNGVLLTCDTPYSILSLPLGDEIAMQTIPLSTEQDRREAERTTAYIRRLEQRAERLKGQRAYRAQLKSTLSLLETARRLQALNLLPTMEAC